MKYSRSIAYASAIICCATAPALAPFGGGGGADFDLSWHTIDGGGGGSSTGGGFELAGTIGQHDAGATMTGGTFALTGGFWSAAGGAIRPACPWDLDGNGTADTVDLLAMLGAWGPCVGCNEDINGDNVVDVVDLLILLGGWGPCPR